MRSGISARSRHRFIFKLVRGCGARPGITHQALLPACCAAAGLALIAGCGTPYTSREHLTLTAPAPAMATFILRNAVGEVTLQADPAATEVRAEIVKIGKGSSPQQADAALEQIEVSLETHPGRSEAVEARAEHPPGGPIRNYEVEWKLTAPPGFALDVSTQVGDIVAEGFSGGATFKTDVGDIKTSGKHLGLSAKTGVGDIHAEAAGRIDVRTDVGDARLRVLPGDEDDVKARTQVGELTVELPVGRKGRLKAGADVGSLRLRLESLTLRGEAHRLEADLGGASTPTLDLATDVGDLTVRSYSSATETAKASP